jgi:hypothetical protein
MQLALQARELGQSAVESYFVILLNFIIAMHDVVIMQGIESNVRHHKRNVHLLWGEQRQDDYFKDFPHGGRLDNRFTRANNVNGTLYSPKGYTKAKANLVDPKFWGMAAPWSIPVPMQHYSHMLNYDYFKVNQPYVRHLTLCASDTAVVLTTTMRLPI